MHSDPRWRVRVALPKALSYWTWQETREELFANLGTRPLLAGKVQISLVIRNIGISQALAGIQAFYIGYEGGIWKECHLLRRNPFGHRLIYLAVFIDDPNL